MIIPFRVRYGDVSKHENLIKEKINANFQTYFCIIIVSILLLSEDYKLRKDARLLSTFTTYYFQFLLFGLPITGMDF